jgi:phosphoribosylanthranilate isomerase
MAHALVRADGRPFLKVCGLTREEDVAACATAGVDAIGLNFYPPSPRFVSFARAAQLAHTCDLLRVALFVDAPLAEIARVAESGWADAIQLHGHETPETVAQVRALGLPVIRARALRTADDIVTLLEAPADAFLVDAYTPHALGGTGHVGDWALAEKMRRDAPDRVLWLAGGLRPENAAAAAAAVCPHGLDTASGVETSPGVKSAALINAFVQAARP